LEGEVWDGEKKCHEVFIGIEMCKVRAQNDAADYTQFNFFGQGTLWPVVLLYTFNRLFHINIVTFNTIRWHCNCFPATIIDFNLLSFLKVG